MQPRPSQIPDSAATVSGCRPHQTDRCSCVVLAVARAELNTSNQKRDNCNVVWPSVPASASLCPPPTTEEETKRKPRGNTSSPSTHVLESIAAESERGRFVNLVFCRRAELRCIVVVVHQQRDVFDQLLFVAYLCSIATTVLFIGRKESGQRNHWAGF